MQHGTTIRRCAAGAFAAILSALALSATATTDSRDGASAVEARAREISAFYMFRSWANPDRLVLIMNVSAGQHPAEGPDYFRFADDVAYRLNIDNDLDGVADDLVYELRFVTEHRAGAPGYPWPHIGQPASSNPNLRGITALRGPGSEGLVVRQLYSVTQIRGGVRSALFQRRALVAVPANVGPDTMPDYEALAAQGIYRDSRTGVRVFAGQRAETFYRDTGALHDGVNLRRSPPFLSEAEDNDNLRNPYGINRFREANVQSIVVEIPITLATRDRKAAEATAVPLIGAYASVHELGSDHHHHRGNDAAAAGNNAQADFRGAHFSRSRQVSRMGNPSFRMFLVDPATRQRWDAARPEHDAQFQELLKHPGIARLLADATGVPTAPEPRVELVQIILKYPNQPVSGTDCGAPCADLLRMNLRVPPTPPEQQHRLGALLSPDPAGLPNGCRPNDDVTDITLRAFGGPAYFAARIADGINFQDAAPGAGSADGPGYGALPGNRLDVTRNGIVKEFPFQPTPHSGWHAGAAD